MDGGSMYNEEDLQKSMSTQQEKKQFTDKFLKSRKDNTAKAVKLVFASMMDEIERVLKQ